WRHGAVRSNATGTKTSARRYSMRVLTSLRPSDEMRGSAYSPTPVVRRRGSFRARRTPPQIQIDPIGICGVEQDAIGGRKREKTPARRAHGDPRLTTSRRDAKDLRWLTIPGRDGLKEIHDPAVGRPRGPVRVPTASRRHDLPGIAAVDVGNQN